MFEDFTKKQTARAGRLRKGLLKTPVAGSAYKKAESLGLQMGFANLMYSYTWLFRMTAFRHDSFKERLAEKEFTLLMKDKEGASQRWFCFSGGKIRTMAQKGPDPDFSLIWKTIPAGCKIMADMAMGKPKVLKNAIIDGNLLLAGDAAMVAWFLETNNQMAKLNRKRAKLKSRMV
ncbi:hypothetical protein SAMN02745216_03807 [Desulfatibacillum alkenivorans DSM 16219]|jgi:hypothetical protein|uniref:SCP-2 sterol transfer family protein n=1 Tax=Desulfatibacillum alkenivorans DSM 16219 TaxID=1121393 RepID=A0A1M6U3W1_9BACT|nr:hypothetical protein [Desulfatibacillum alkenivorans]SHK63831.1 hypothetical protein SAMN02745216_03807 [Desulfatibacillum alkenivorans DSM 16219]